MPGVSEEILTEVYGTVPYSVSEQPACESVFICGGHFRVFNSPSVNQNGIFCRVGLGITWEEFKLGRCRAALRELCPTLFPVQGFCRGWFVALFPGQFLAKGASVNYHRPSFRFLTLPK